MTSSPTPAVLPDAQAREVLAQAAERAGCKEVPAWIRAGEVVLINSTIALDALATPHASDAAVPAGEVADALKALDRFVTDHTGNDDTMEGMEVDERARSALTILRRSHLAAGWSHVPINRTKAMIDAGAEADAQDADSNSFPGDWAHPENQAKATYAAMLAAAPEVASDTGAGSREADIEARARAIAQQVVPYEAHSPHVSKSQMERRSAAKAAARLALATLTDATDGATGGGEVRS